MLPFLLKPLSHLTAAESIVRDVLQRLPIPFCRQGSKESAEENGSSPGRGVRARRVILRRVGSGGQCRWGGLLFCR